MGEGHFSLVPVGAMDKKELVRRQQSETVEQDFNEVVFRFTPKMYPQLVAGFANKVETPSEATAAFDRYKDKVRDRHESPISFTQAFSKATRWTTWTPTWKPRC